MKRQGTWVTAFSFALPFAVIIIVRHAIYMGKL